MLQSAWFRRGEAMLALVPGRRDSHEDRIRLNHTFNKGQIAWFKVGRALNLMGGKNRTVPPQEIQGTKSGHVEGL